MDKKEMQQTILEVLTKHNPPRWHGCHTEEKNLLKRFPTHMRGTKEVKKALEELYRMEFINKYMKQANLQFAVPENHRFSENW